MSEPAQPIQAPPAPYRSVGALRLALVPLSLIAVAAYPAIALWLVAAVGVRIAGLLLLAVGSALGLFARRTLGLGRGPGLAVALATPVLVALAVALDDWSFLALVPAAVYLTLAGVLDDSLTVVPLIERAARLMHSLVPDFAGPYCRTMTIAWSGFFAANALFIAGLVLAGQAELWTRYTSWIVYALMTGLVLAELLFRKVWFRNYGRGPLDRGLAALLPAERTWRGRRSLAYIDEMRRMLHERGER